MTRDAAVLPSEGREASGARDVRGVIFDLDGTIYRGGVPIPGAAAAITGSTQRLWVGGF